MRAHNTQENTQLPAGEEKRLTKYISIYESPAFKGVQNTRALHGG